MTKKRPSKKPAPFENNEKNGKIEKKEKTEKKEKKPGADTKIKPPDLTVTFHPEKSGLEKFMGRLESEVMKVVWTNGPMTVKRAVYFINKEHKYAYTTIMTIMARLSEKGLLSRKKQGQSYFYTPTTDEKQFIRLAAEKVLAGLMGDYRSVTLNIFHRVRKATKPTGD